MKKKNFCFVRLLDKNLCLVALLNDKRLNEIFVHTHTTPKPQKVTGHQSQIDALHGTRLFDILFIVNPSYW